MTTPEFLALLGEIRDQFDWTLQPDTGYGSGRRVTPRLHLRATLKKCPSTVFDPVSAVCFAHTGKIFRSGICSGVAEELDMDSAVAAGLTAAANDRIWAGTEGEQTPVEHLMSLRSRLLEAVGLQSEVESATPVRAE